VVLASDTSVETSGTGSANGDITFTAKIDGPGGLTLNSALSAVDVAGVIGSSTRLAFVIFSGETITVDDALTTGAQSYESSDSTTIFEGTTYDTNGGDFAVSGAAVIDIGANTLGIDTTGMSEDGIISFTDTITSAMDGASGINLNAGTGNITVTGDIGGEIGGMMPSTTRLSIVTMTGNALEIHDVNTTGLQSYTGSSIIFNSSYATTGGSFTASGPVDLGEGGMLVETAGGNISFSDSVVDTEGGDSSFTY